MSLKKAIRKIKRILKNLLVLGGSLSVILLVIALALAPTVCIILGIIWLWQNI